MESVTLKIKALNPEFTGVSAGIEFQNGEAIVSLSTLKPHVIDYFKNKGYEVTKLDAEITKVTNKKAKK